MITVVTMIFAFTAAEAFSLGPDDGLMRQAREYCEKGQYEKAIGVYAQLLRGNADPPLINYNAGTVYYLMEDHEAAISSFRKALCSRDTDLERDAFFGIGNCYYRMSEEKEEDNILESIDLCRKSMEYYEKGMEVNEEDRKLKYNYEVADMRLRALGIKAQKEVPPGPKGGEKLKAGRQNERDSKKRQRREEEHRRKREREKEDKEK